MARYSHIADCEIILNQGTDAVKSYMRWSTSFFVLQSRGIWEQHKSLLAGIGSDAEWVAMSRSLRIVDRIVEGMLGSERDN